MPRSPRGVLIVADMEGVTGIADPDLFDGSSPAWRAYGRRLLTSDINAAAEGARQGGAQRVFVCDAHNLGNNIHTATLAAGITGLPPYSAATNLRGLPLVHRIYERSGIEAVILVGYHAMAGGGGYEPHTCMPDVVEDVRINGQSVITNWRTSKMADPSNLQQKLMEKNMSSPELIKQAVRMPKKLTKQSVLRIHQRKLQVTTMNRRNYTA